MVVYQLRGPIVEVTGWGLYASAEWDAVFDDVRKDLAIPEAAPFLIDSRDLQVDMSSVQMVDRIRNLRERLGSKLGSQCALVMSEDGAFFAHQFQYFADDVIRLRVGIFRNPSDADRWLLGGSSELR